MIQKRIAFLYICSLMFLLRELWYTDADLVVERCMEEFDKSLTCKDFVTTSISSFTRCTDDTFYWDCEVFNRILGSIDKGIKEFGIDVETLGEPGRRWAKFRPKKDGSVHDVASNAEDAAAQHHQILALSGDMPELPWLGGDQRFTECTFI
jgi:hypothetical protein